MQNEPGNITDDLLVKYLLDEASETERAEVQLWTEQNTGNKKYFEHFRLIWDQSKNLAAESTIDTNAAWERFQHKVANTRQSAKVIPLSRPVFTWVRVAAVLLVMLGAGWMYYYNVSSNAIIALHSKNTILTQTLPDGSIVTLNKNSSISYPKAFKGNTRNITLEGEAFFNVTPDKSKPFIIKVDDVSVRVVGTSFNIKNTKAKTEVIVETGIVEVTRKKQGVTLNPKEKAIVEKDKAVFSKESSTDELYNYYRTREFICNATPLWSLVDVLNEVYNTNIVIADDKLKNLPLTTTFHDESLDKILEVIGETFNINVEKVNGNIILK